jgi:uncharacterized protein YkwD
VAVVLAAGLGLGSTSLPSVVEAGKGYNPDKQECQFLKQINSYRGGGKLKLSASLGRAAESHSKDQARRDKMFHSNLSQLMNRVDYDARPVGENVAWGTSLDGAKQVFNAWKKSPGHDRNMRDKDFEAIGIARAKGNKGWYWTTIFGAKADRTVNC